MTLPRPLRALTLTPLLVIACAVFGPLSAARADAADPSGQPMPGALAGWNEVYANDFTSSDLSAFQVYNGPAPEPGACWAANHLVVTGGELQFKGYSDPTQLAALGCTNTSYEDVTAGLKLSAISQTYGMYEVRARVDAGQGVSIAAQLWPTDNDWNNGIVFAEDNGEPTRSSNLATEYSSSTNAVNRQSSAVDMTQWHTYGVQWSPGSVTYTIDGKVWGSVTSPDIPDVPMQLALQTESWQCGANSWEECVSSSSPAEVDMDVDWIVDYQASSPATSATPTAATASTPTTTKTPTTTASLGVSTSTTAHSPTSTSTSSTRAAHRRHEPRRPSSHESLNRSAQPAAITLGASGHLLIGRLGSDGRGRRGYLRWVVDGARSAVGTGTVWDRHSGASRRAGVAKLSASRVRNGAFTRLTTEFRDGRRGPSIRHWVLIDSHGKYRGELVASSARAS